MSKVVNVGQKQTDIQKSTLTKAALRFRTKWSGLSYKTNHRTNINLFGCLHFYSAQI